MKVTMRMMAMVGGGDYLCLARDVCRDDGDDDDDSDDAAFQK